ncbi:MAG: hypothetical protein Q8M17_10640 [Actinomycetota bacterium]|nr:hypothetical protein [Actinomycetota bacterium]
MSEAIGPHEDHCPAVPMTREDGSVLYVGYCICDALRDEREACARKVDENADAHARVGLPEYAHAMRSVASQIRARGEA